MTDADQFEVFQDLAAGEKVVAVVAPQYTEETLHLKEEVLRNIRGQEGGRREMIATMIDAVEALADGRAKAWLTQIAGAHSEED